MNCCRNTNPDAVSLDCAFVRSRVYYEWRGWLGGRWQEGGGGEVLSNYVANEFRRAIMPGMSLSGENGELESDRSPPSSKAGPDLRRCRRPDRSRPSSNGQDRTMARAGMAKMGDLSTCAVCGRGGNYLKKCEYTARHPNHIQLLKPTSTPQLGGACESAAYCSDGCARQCSDFCPFSRRRYILGCIKPNKLALAFVGAKITR